MKIFSLIKKMKPRDWLALFILGITFIPGKIWKRFSPNIWVVSEYEKLARDNGYWFYHFMKKRHPEIKSYYPISRDSMDKHKITRLGNGIKHGGLKHYMLFWAANVWCSSSSIQGFPYPRICDDLVLMNLHRFKFIFLNHGITRGHSYIVNGKTTNYDLLITCSEFDRHIILEENDQKENIVVNTGFARHDMLDDSMTDKVVILVMPTWRENLSYRNENTQYGREKYTKLFLKSDYYKKYNELINDDELISYMNENNLKLIFFLHQNAQPYVGYFKSRSDRIIVARQEDYDVQTLLKQAAILITDYSSVCYDFSYMLKPMIYFQFDLEEFEKEQYAQGKAFTYKENGFGNQCFDLSSLKSEIRRLYDLNFVMEDKFKNRVLDYFTYRDRKNCERIYNAIIGILK